MARYRAAADWTCRSNETLQEGAPQQSTFGSPPMQSRLDPSKRGVLSRRCIVDVIYAFRSAGRKESIIRLRSLDMLLDFRQLEALTEADLQSLVDNQVAEDKALEFKRELPGGSESAKKEFL